MNDKFEVFTDDAFPGQFRVVGDKIEKVRNSVQQRVVQCGAVFLCLTVFAIFYSTILPLIFNASHSAFLIFYLSTYLSSCRFFLIMYYVFIYSSIYSLIFIYLLFISPL